MLVSKKIRSFATFLVMLCIHAQAAANADVPQARELDYAKNFTIEEYADYKLLTVSNAYRNARSVYRYALIPHSATLPDDLPRDAIVIRTPVQRVVIMETVYVGYLDTLDQLDQICGAASPSYINHPKVIQGVESGDIQGIQSGQKLNIERLLLLQPDLYFGEAYSNGDIQIKNGSLTDFLDIALMNIGRGELNFFSMLINKFYGSYRYLTNFNFIKKSKMNVSHHYDIKDDLYDLFLDPKRQYSCAYFQNENDSLETCLLYTSPSPRD